MASHKGLHFIVLRVWPTRKGSVRMHLTASSVWANREYMTVGYVNMALICPANFRLEGRKVFGR